MKLENLTPFEAERYGLNDENGKNLLLVVMKATYSITPDNKLELAEKQEPIEMADQYYGEPGYSSIKYASDFSFDKTATDVALLGHAYAPKRGAKESEVSLQIGPVQKKVKVFGDRRWKKHVGVSMISSSEPFEKIPLVYERAFGGVDESHAESKNHEAEPRNPIGVGFRAKKSKLKTDGAALPNFEDPDNPIKKPSSRPGPAGFGFISPAWQPRLGFAGTYDEAWQKSRSPLLPDDFDKNFFNSAHPDLVCPGFLKGDEPVMASGVSPLGPLRFSLPGVQPLCSVELVENDEEQQIEMNLAKAVLDADDRRLILVWSGNMRIEGECQDVENVKCELEQE